VEFSGVKVTEDQVEDILRTLGFVTVAVLLPGYIQLNYGISALRLSLMIVFVYLIVHMFIEHITLFHH
jgi:Ca2+/Na+ antiporter